MATGIVRGESLTGGQAAGILCVETFPVPDQPLQEMPGGNPGESFVPFSDALDRLSGELQQLIRTMTVGGRDLEAAVLHSHLLIPKDRVISDK